MQVDPDVPVDVPSFNAAITACSRSGQWELSLALFREMTKLGVGPDVVSYNSVMSALGGAKEWKRAVSVLREMTPNESGSAGAGGGGDGSDVSPDHVSFATAIQACEMARRFEEADGLRAEAAALDLLPMTERDVVGDKGTGGEGKHDGRGVERHTTIACEM